jgi:signal transduction histidine kinase
MSPSIPLSDDSGRFSGLIGISTDITERKQMEHSLRQNDERLRIPLEDREQLAEDLHDGDYSITLRCRIAGRHTKKYPPVRCTHGRQTTATVIGLTAINAEHLFYVIQEALSNVIRHAYARTVVVQLCWTSSGIRVTGD